MPEILPEGVFSMPICTPTYDVGWDRRLRLSSLLRWQQEAGEQQLIGYDMQWEKMAARGFVFVLTRAAGVLHRMPVSSEPVRLETWQQAITGACFLRGYRLIGEGEERLADCASTFAVVDVNTHRPLRPRVVEPQVLPSVQRESPCTVPPRLRPPKDGFVDAREWTVLRSAVDFNGHLNNAVYADLLTDFLPAAVAEKAPRAFALQFEHEARLGDRLTLRHAMDGDAVFVEGWREDIRCFSGRVTF